MPVGALGTRFVSLPVTAAASAAPAVGSPRLLEEAQAQKARAVEGETMTQWATIIGAPAGAVGTGLLVSAIGSSPLGWTIALAAVAGAILTAIGLALYFLVFKKKEEEADAVIEAVQQQIVSPPPPSQPPTATVSPAPPAPVTRPPQAPPKPFPTRPAFVAEADKTAQQKGMDAFLKKANAEYTFVDRHGKPLVGPRGELASADGKPFKVHVTPGFRMVGGLEQIPAKAARELLLKTLKEDGVLTDRLRRQINRIAIGRASLDDIKTVTQALISNGHLEFDASRKGSDMWWHAVRNLQWKFGIGLDCAGYVSQDRSNLIKLSGAEVDKMLDGTFLNGDALNLKADKRFESIALPQTQDRLPEVKPGDVIRLKDRKGEVGHWVIVYEAHQLTDKDKAFYLDPRIDEKKLLQDGKVTMYVVDSSWGANGDADYEGAGVVRRVMFYNEKSNEWSMYHPMVNRVTPFIYLTKGPYGHILEGVYRFKK